MKLSKALRIKNQIVSQINKVQTIIEKYNSYNIQNKPKWDVNEQWTKLMELKTKLIDLKTKISIANRPILPIIHKMEELKSILVFLGKVSTTEGIKQDSYSNKTTEYGCFISDTEKSSMLDGIQDDIYSLQDTLAEHNAKTEISFSL